MKPRTLIPVLWLSLAMAMSTAFAGDGHDHGDAPPATNSSGPKRLPDGGVFLPKPAQRQISVRTLPVMPPVGACAPVVRSLMAHPHNARAWTTWRNA